MTVKLWKEKERQRKRKRKREEGREGEREGEKVRKKEFSSQAAKSNIHEVVDWAWMYGPACTRDQIPWYHFYKVH